MAKKPAAPRAGKKRRVGVQTKLAANRAARRAPKRSAAAAAKSGRRPAAGNKAAAADATLQGRPPNAPRLIPSLTVRSAEDSIAFYQAAFGFRLEFSLPGPGGRIAHAQMTYLDARIMFSAESDFVRLRAPVSSGLEDPVQHYVYCPDIDAFTAHARAAGARVLCEPTNMFWGDRMATFLDADGYRWAFATNVAPFQPQQMADPGMAAQA